LPGGTLSVLFTDLAGSTEMLSRLGDEAADVLLRQHFALLREAVAEHDGEEVKNLGDGLMVVFPRPNLAVSCAAAMQDGVDRHNREQPEEPFGLRVGVNHGEVISVGEDYFGTSVVMAKRLCDRADPSQILVSLATRKLFGSEESFPFRDLGSLSLKGLADPVPTVELVWRDGNGDHGHGVARAAEAGRVEPAPEDDGVVPLPATLASVRGEAIVGRDAQLDTLLGELDLAGGGARKLVLLAGEPGIGKTRLAAEAAGIAHDRGATVLFGRSDEGGMTAFQPFLEAIDDYVEHGPVSVLRDQPHENLSVLARLVPRLARRVAIVERSHEDPETERYRLFEAILSLLSTMTRGKPVVLVLDDLHWADKASLLVLRHIMSAAEESPLMIVGTYRDVEVGRGHPLTATLTDLHRSRGFTRLDLAGVDEAAVEGMIAAWAGQQPPPGLAHAIWHETEGHPFFVEEVLRHLLETGTIHERHGQLSSSILGTAGIPESIKSVVESRIASLGEETQRSLLVAAVVGREFSADLLERVSETPSVALYEQLEEAIGARLVAEAPGSVGRYRFSHALVRETLYSQISGARRTHLHARVAEALEGMEEGGRELLPDLAHHYFEAAAGSDLLDKAIDYAAKAGEHASSQLAYEEAATQFQRALHGLRLKDADERRQCELLLELGENLWNSGEYGQARDAFREGAGLAERLNLPDHMARAALGVGGRMGLPLEGGIIDTVLIAMLRRALELLGASDQPMRARLLGRLGSALLFSAERDRAEELAEEAIAIARGTGDEALISRILSDTWIARLRHGNLDRRLREGREWVELADRTGVTPLRLESRLWWTASLFENGDLDLMERELELCDAFVAELHQPYYTWFFTVFAASRAMMGGDLERGEALMWEALETGQNSDNPCAAELFAPQVLMLRLLQGRIAETHAGSKAITEHFASISAFRSGLVLIYAELGLEQETRREFERLAVNNFTDIADDIFWLSTVFLLVDVCVFLGDRDRAAMLYELLLPCEGRFVALGAVCSPAGSAERALGTLAGMLGRYDEAEARLRLAADFEQSAGAPPMLALTRCEQARLLAARSEPGDEAEARRHLDEAIALATRHALPGVENRARAMLEGLDGAGTVRRRRVGEVASRLRDDAKAAVSTRGRAGLGRLLSDASDEELQRRFGSAIALRGMFTAMARGFQPRMAFGFEGEIAFEIWRRTASGTAHTSDWWTIQIKGSRAVARHRTANDPAVTIHGAVPDFIRVVAGVSNPVTAWVEKRLEVEGDVTLGTRLVELFGGEAPLDLAA